MGLVWYKIIKLGYQLYIRQYIFFDIDWFILPEVTPLTDITVQLENLNYTQLQKKQSLFIDHTALVLRGDGKVYIYQNYI